MNINISKIILCKFNQIIKKKNFYILLIYSKCIDFNYKIYYVMYIYVLFNILVTFIFIILVFSELLAILLTIVNNEKHVKSSDSDQHVTQKLLTLKGLSWMIYINYYEPIR